MLYFSKNEINKFLKSLTLGRISIEALSVGTAKAGYQKPWNTQMIELLSRNQLIIFNQLVLN